jgi:hypothetical protein
MAFSTKHRETDVLEDDRILVGSPPPPDSIPNSGSEQSFGDQRFPERHRLLAVDLQDEDRRPVDGGAADQQRPVIVEVVAPLVSAGMEEYVFVGRFPEALQKAADLLGSKENR